MRKNISLFIILLFIILLNSCKKTGTAPLPSTPAACKLVKESSTLSGNEDTYEYAYGADGNISSIKKFIGGHYHVLQDSSLVSDISIAGYNVLDWPYGSNLIKYDLPFELFPTKAQVSQTEGAITHVNQYTYFFFYDSKNRLYKVGEQTDYFIGDYEYDLTIYYNDQDNVTGLSYEFTTGPRTVTTITSSGYDDKPTPFAGIKNWPFIMHAAWNNYDPEPLFTALSKNNPLGYTMPDGLKREMSYVYNDKGLPVKRMNTNKNSSGTYSFEETFDYDCQ